MLWYSLKYSLAVVGDRGVARPLYASSRLHKEAMYIETPEHKYVARVGCACYPSARCFVVAPGRRGLIRCVGVVLVCIGVTS